MTKAKEEAQGYLDTYLKGDKTAEAFGKLADEKSDAKAEGGLYESMGRSDLPEALEAWLYSADRKEGDSGIVKTSAGWHVMYYIGESEDSAWMSTADTSIIGERYEAVIEENSTGITYNDDVVNSISLN